MTELLRPYVADRWVTSEDTYPLFSPSTGEQLGSVVRAGSTEVDAAVTAARQAFASTRWLPLRDRVALCYRIAELIEADLDGLATGLAAEQGKPLAEARGEVTKGASGFRLAAEEARRLDGSVRQADDPEKRVLVIRQARGVWALITPWNFPCNIAIEYLGPAVATGTPFVWKPAPSTPWISCRLTEIMLTAGAPEGMVNLVLTDRVETAEHLVSHPGIDAIGLTGSAGTGEKVARAAWDKHLLLELGGNGPVIVLDDADPERAIPAAALSSFRNAGQVCSAAGRLLVAEPRADELVAGLRDAAAGLVLGPSLDPVTSLGPVHAEVVAATMDRHVGDAVERGARVVYGGARASGRATALYYQPTVLDGVSPEAHVNAEETFGPIAPVVRFADDEAILAAANAGGFGLVSAVFTTSLKRAFHFAERLETGTVVVNDSSNYWELHLPFGGRAGKRSGRGRLGGRHTLEEFTQLKTVSIDVS